jgi:hypothetical protein
VPALTPGHVAPVDRIAQRADTARVATQIADGGEAGHQRGARIPYTIEHVVGGFGVERGHPRSHRIAADAEQVNVHVDQPRQHEPVAEIDQRRPRFRCDETIADFRDLAATHDHRTGAAWSLAGTVEQRAGLDERHPCRPGRHVLRHRGTRQRYGQHGRQHPVHDLVPRFRQQGCPNRGAGQAALRATLSFMRASCSGVASA